MKEAAKKPQIAIYQGLAGDQKICVRIEDENVWLTQKLIAELFNVDVRTVNEHLVNIYRERELDENATIRNFRIVQKEALREVTRDVKHYNLDAILAIGYRVRSDRGTQFRKWASERLREYLIKGFTLDDERLKQGGGRARYFQELLQRVRDIRSSERMFYQKVTDIYATSIDYKVDTELTQKFLTEPEINQLNLIVSLYIDFAELQGSSGRLMKMQDWIRKLDEFLTISEKKLLHSAGKVSTKQAEEKALKEYEKYRKEQDKNYVSDFDREVKKILEMEKRKSKS